MNDILYWIGLTVIFALAFIAGRASADKIRLGCEKQDTDKREPSSENT
ncbi:MAG: hypothetical protein V7754_15715 [Halioglobus sp.]